jgi:ppGpp synthetase/RelA/SpoT-type nucleotidyltranferase
MGKLHAAPTDRTIKELYGTASLCAFPDCREPLYRVAPDGGHIRNADICHIHARAEGGRRWNPDQTGEENRSPGNLLLLCFPHHEEIDDPTRIMDFPAERLRDWKQRQTAAAQSAGYQLTDAEAKEVALALWPQPSITMQADVISLGGQGGAAIGAGGGGGGAIGHGARAGDGGPGGATRFKTSGAEAAALGAGGGGGGALHLSRREWPAPAGTQKTLSKENSSGVRLTSLHLADCARIQVGLLYVLGAGWEYVVVQTLPAEIVCALVCIVQLSGIEPETTIILRVMVRDPDGICALEEEFPVANGVARPVIAVNSAMTLRFPEPAVIARHDEQERGPGGDVQRCPPSLSGDTGSAACIMRIWSCACGRAPEPGRAGPGATRAASGTQRGRTRRRRTALSLGRLGSYADSCWTMPLDIQAAVVRYEREFDRYVKLAEAVYERCLQIVEETGVRATVQRRTKTPQSLRKKLLRIQRQVPADTRFATVDDVFANMSDLAGVRVGTYLESDRARIVEELRRSFDFADGSVGHPNSDEKNKSGRAKHYRAIHCQVLLKADDLQGVNSNLAGTSCEVQVCSMLAHVWNEIEHDVGYKPETGAPSESELDSLDVLGQLARAGDVVIKALLDANRERVANSETPFGSEFDFMARMQRQFPDTTQFHVHAAQLFNVLLEFGLDSPSKIREAILGEGDGYKARASELADQLDGYIESLGDNVVAVEKETSDLLAVLLLDRKLDDLLALYPVGRGMGRPMRLVSLAKRFEAMRSHAEQGARDEAEGN